MVILTPPTGLDLEAIIITVNINKGIIHVDITMYLHLVSLTIYERGRKETF